MNNRLLPTSDAVQASKTKAHTENLEPLLEEKALVLLNHQRPPLIPSLASFQDNRYTWSQGQLGRRGREMDTVATSVPRMVFKITLTTA